MSKITVKSSAQKFILDVRFSIFLLQKNFIYSEREKQERLKRKETSFFWNFVSFSKRQKKEETFIVSQRRKLFLWFEFEVSMVLIQKPKRFFNYFVFVRFTMEFLFVWTRPQPRCFVWLNLISLMALPTWKLFVNSSTNEVLWMSRSKENQSPTMWWLRRRLESMESFVLRIWSTNSRLVAISSSLSTSFWCLLSFLLQMVVLVRNSFIFKRVGTLVIERKRSIPWFIEWSKGKKKEISRGWIRWSNVHRMPIEWWLISTTTTITKKKQQLEVALLLSRSRHGLKKLSGFLQWRLLSCLTHNTLKVQFLLVKKKKISFFLLTKSTEMAI